MMVVGGQDRPFLIEVGWRSAYPRGSFPDPGAMPLRSLLILLLAVPLMVQASVARFVVDGDGDGVPDDRDRCPYTPFGAVVDQWGCSGTEDMDADGVPDLIDMCPFTPPGAVVDRYGCAIDSDFDGIADGIDLCPDTPLGAVVDARGCQPGLERPTTRLAAAPVPTPTPRTSRLNRPPAAVPATPAVTSPAAPLPSARAPSVLPVMPINAASVAPSRAAVAASPRPAAAAWNGPKRQRLATVDASSGAQRVASDRLEVLRRELAEVTSPSAANEAYLEVVGYTSTELPSSRVIPQVLHIERFARELGVAPDRILHVVRPARSGQRAGTVEVFRR